MTAKELVKWLEEYARKKQEMVIRFQKQQHWLTGQDIERNIEVRYLNEVVGLLDEEIKRFEQKQKDAEVFL